MNYTNILVAATGIVALANANPNVSEGNFGESSAGSAHLKLSDYLSDNGGSYTGIGSMTIKTTSKTDWNINDTSVVAFFMCIPVTAAATKHHCYVGEVTDPKNGKQHKFSYWMDKTIASDATLDNSASLMTQVKALFADADPDCSSTKNLSNSGWQQVSDARCRYNTDESVWIDIDATKVEDKTFEMIVWH